MGKELLFAVTLLLVVTGIINVSYKSNFSNRTKRAIGTKPPGVQGTCGGARRGRSGYIASQNFPHGNYPAGLNCNWTIVVRTGYVIKFEFRYMDVEDAPVQKGSDCGADAISIYDGTRITDPLVGGQKFCGPDTVFNPVYSTKKRVRLNFKTDFSDQFEGFAIFWSAVRPPSVSFNCDFESLNGLCVGWTQHSSANFLWKHHSGRTPSGIMSATGPTNDHTHQSADGKYLYIEASGIQPGKRAI
uniref:CUB domain-containing protein n=2 Tax=Ciona intestinalis TaxID=7719 RepID=H2XVH7_CIOIN